MSEEAIDLYYPVPFHEDHNPSIYYHTPSSVPHSSTQSLQGFDHSYMSFIESCSQGSTDHNIVARAFGSSPTLSEASPMAEYRQKPVAVPRDLAGGSETPVTPNSSMSSSSTEAGADENINKSKNEEEPKGLDDEGDRSKKVIKGKKKGEKKEKEQRFAFMTKSEVDHLEDGYRWRKYGQKAVKNSPYPRSYYRCTTQKCTVKKRVERSFQDPTIVITTYEGQHNHLIPATLRGNIAGMYSHSMLSPVAAAPSFSQELNMRVQRMPQVLYNYGGSGSIYSQALAPLQQLQDPDYGLLQDMVPSVLLKQDP